MITCKEDLHNTWIKNDKGELRDLYISLAKSFGIIDETCHGGLPFIGIFSEWEGCEIVGNTSQLLFGQESRKQLTIKDLKKEKPKPTKFVKVEESIFDLKGEFERGELYSSDCDGHYTQIKCEKKLYLATHQYSVYRQVEIDWRDEVVDLFDSRLIARRGNWFLIGGVYVPSSTLVKLSHRIASLTEKPE